MEWKPIREAEGDECMIFWKPDQPRSGRCMFIGYFDELGNIMPVAGGHPIQGVTHWMSLPEPPVDTEKTGE